MLPFYYKANLIGMQLIISTATVSTTYCRFIYFFILILISIAISQRPIKDGDNTSSFWNPAIELLLEKKVDINCLDLPSGRTVLFDAVHLLDRFDDCQKRSFTGEEDDPHNLIHPK